MAWPICCGRTPDGAQSTMTGEPLLSVRDLRTFFVTDRGVLRAVDGVSFDLYAGETFGIVGESGSGKSVTCRSLIGLLPSPPAHTTGTVRFGGRNLVGLPMSEMQKVRGAQISMIFQDPMSSLNPVMSVGDQIAEAMEAHTSLNRAERRKAAIELMRSVGIPLAGRRAGAYPPEFSGGTRPPSLIDPPPGCRFYERCSLRTDQCRDWPAELLTVGQNHLARCLRHEHVEEIA